MLIQLFIHISIDSLFYFKGYIILLLFILLLKPFPLWSLGDLSARLLCPNPIILKVLSIQFSSVQSLSCVRLFATVNCSTLGIPVHHKLPEFSQTHAHRVGDPIQPSHPLLYPFSSCPQSLPASGSFPMSQLKPKLL